MSKELLKVSHISKYFSGVKALDDVSFDLVEGEAHAICGENGAGKSTLIKILTGAHEPTSGSFIFDGVEYTGLTPFKAKNIGILAVYQELSLVPYLSVADNLFLGHEIMQKNKLFKDTKAMNEKARELLLKFGVDIDPARKINTLGIAQQQLVEIVKGISADAKLYIMDEPTAALTVKETQIFFDIMAKLKEQGKTIIYISHRLEEVFDICDRVTVFMDGHSIVTKNVKDIDKHQLISYMVGHEMRDDYPELGKPSDEIVLSVKNVKWSNRLRDVSFDLHKGEVLGIGGLIGAGRTEVAQSIYGAIIPDSGEYTLNGKPYKPRSPSYALKKGIGLIPEDRKGQGILPVRSIRDNICVTVYDKLKNLFFFIGADKEKNLTGEYINKLAIKTPSLNQQIKNLSGGNQQKCILAKMLAADCDILIFDEPTRGIDVAAKAEIYSLMKELIDQGKSIIMISSEMPELIGMSHRVVVMSNGYSVAQLSKEELTQIKILELASSKL